MVSLLVGTQQGRDYISSELAGGESSSGEVTAIKIYSSPIGRDFDSLIDIALQFIMFIVRRRQTKEKMKEKIYITWFQKYKGLRKDK